MSRRMLVTLLVIVTLMLFLLVPELLNGRSVFDAYLSSRGLNVSLIVDWTSPQLELLLPENTTYPENSVPVSWNASDEHSAVDSVWYNINDGQNITIAAPANISVPAGTHTFNIFVNDSAGNMNFSSVIFSTYEVEEPEEPEEPGPGGGGGFGSRGENLTNLTFQNASELLPTELPEQAPVKKEEVQEIPAEQMEFPFKQYKYGYIIAAIIALVLFLLLLAKQRKRERYATSLRKRKDRLMPIKQKKELE